jgi:glycosyltransferase involved in cell wall biosynthesis
MPERSVAYLCLQATRQGQASYAHVNEIVAGLVKRDWKVDLEQPEYAEGTGSPPGALGRALEFLRVQRRFRGIARDADIVYIRAHFAAWPTALWARRMGLPVVQEVNGPYEDIFTAWPWTRRLAPVFVRLARSQYRRADALIAVTPGLARWLNEETGRGDATVIPNGANTELFRPDAAAPPGLPDRYVVFFGALAAWQGVETMLDALRDTKWPPGVSLVIAGDGFGRHSVEKATGSDPRILYLGVRPYAEMPGLVAGSVAGLSVQGGAVAQARAGLFAPLKLYEIAACGVPAIVTDFPGQADLVRQHECGIVIPPDDPSALAAAVARLADDAGEARAMGARGRAAIVAAHSWDARAEATSRLLESVLEVRKER